MTDQELPPSPAAADDLPEQLRVRREKRERLLDEGTDPYPVALPITHDLAQVRAEHPDLPADTGTGEQVGVAGRVMFLRNTGKLCFATLRAGDGTELQAMLSRDGVGEEALSSFKSDVDLGDHLFVRGEVITSRRGELSVLAAEWRLAAKALRPLPTTHHDLNEQTRVRQRYVDLIVRDRAARTVRTRAAAMRALRGSMDRRGYVEVETPMLQTLHGGAAARPFVTHSNAFDMDLFLRIAPELYLKRCVVGGIEKVFEINRNFRNEGSDSSHSPEFAMLEFYQAYSDYDEMADLTRRLIQETAEAVHGSQIVTWADGREYDLSGEWPTLTMYGSLSEALETEITPETPVQTLREHAEALGVSADPGHGHGKLVEELWENQVGDHLSAPTFVRDFPTDNAPLTRQHRDQPGVAEKWDLYIAGFELATGYSELVDPVVQRRHLEEQARLAASGDAEAMHVDEDFLRALEYGMPPSGGVGMGIDRLLMALTGLGIRETILFPLVRPE